MKKILIKAEIQNLAKKEILEMVPADTIARIKTTDSKPEFKVYCVGHEGVANAQELSFGRKIVKTFHYVRNMIFRLGEKLQFGTPIFKEHVDTNEHAGREQIGELVGKAVKMIGDKVSALAVTYIYPQYRKEPLDIASIEGEMEYYAKGNDRGDVIDVTKITGIALGSSKVNTPAFPGATLLGVLQAFSKEQQFNRTTEEKMTIAEIIDAIKEAGAKVADLFTPEEIVASEPAKKAKQTEYEHAKRIEKALGEEREKVITLTKTVDESNTKIKTLNEQVNQTQVSTLFTKAHEVRKFEDKQKAFIERRLSGFKSDKTGNDLQLEFDKYLDVEIKEFGEYAKVMGIEVKPAEPFKSGTPAADGKGGGDITDLSSPKNNDFIPAE